MIPQTIRCSSLPLIDLCPPAARVPDVVIELGGQPAALGSAVHEVFANRVNAALALWRDVAPIAEKWGVDAEETRALFGRTWNAWQKVRDFFPNPQIEKDVVAAPHEALTITGRCDLRSKVGTEIRILDLKSGWLETDARPQVKGYGVCSLNEYTPQEAETVYAAVLRPRSMTFEAWRWTRAELESWADDLIRRVLDQVERFNPGEHCSRCKRFYTCPGARAWVQSSIDFLENGDFLGNLLPDELVNLVERARAIEKVCANARAAVKVHVAQAGGKMVGTEKALEIVTTQRREIVYAAGKPILEAAVGVGQLNDLLAVPTTALEAAVKLTAGRGQKTAAVKDLWDRLERAGAVTKVPIERLEVNRNVGEPTAAKG